MRKRVKRSSGDKKDLVVDAVYDGEAALALSFDVSENAVLETYYKNP